MFIPGTPRAWARHAAGGRTRPADARWRLHVRAAWVARFGALALTGPLALTAVFIGPDPRADLDNLCKSVMEALGATGWKDGLAPAYGDDNQIRRIDEAAVTAARSMQDRGVYLALRRLPPPDEGEERNGPWSRT